MASIYITPEEALDAKRKTAKPLMWIGLVGIIMFFAGLTSAYVVRQAQGDWLYFDVPQIFYISTAVIIASSLTMFLAKWFAGRGSMKEATLSLVVTTILGVGFLATQYEGFLELVENGIYFTGVESNASGSFFNVLIWAHAAHVISGVLALIFTTIKALLNKYSAENHIGIEVCGIYWHFLDILWVYLILFLVFIR
ncbi:cytochrome c oxidase subunit 3 [bacterium]|nr:cytochrome c oxidase subunit 3 [bacterium]MDC1221701.1 cytochrome c oxidase subunit 3 [Salibacteraceae bacterium]